MDSNVSDEEQRVALKFCNRYLTGAWTYATLDQVSVNAVSGGLTNLLYRCTLREGVELHEAEPRHVLLRIYGPAQCNTAVQVSIFNQLAKAGLGPSLYSSFEEGRFEEYLPSSPLTWGQLTDGSISRVVTQKIAAIHRLSVHELDCEAEWLIENYRELIDFVAQARREDGNSCLGLAPDALETTRQIARQMIGIDFERELELLCKLLRRSKLPRVFSHNDIHQNNVILLHDTGRRLNDRVVLIDFEYCSYNYLTFDLANYMSEWCFDYSGDEYPKFDFSLERLPSTEKQREILAHYVDNLDRAFRHKLFGSSLSNGDLVDLLLAEMHPMLMASNLLWCIWAIRSVLTSKIKFGYWEMAKCKWEVYMFCKRKLENETSSARRDSGEHRTIRLQASRM